MDRFIAKKMDIDRAYIASKDEITHIAKTLRMQVGDAMEITDGEGNLFVGEISSIDSKEIAVSLIQKIDDSGELNTKIIVYQGIPKSQKMDLIVQKLTEIGVSAIVPVRFERCVRIIKEKEEKENIRWQRIAMEAIKQSKRTVVPQISYSQSISDLESAIKSHDLSILCFENEEKIGIKEILRTMDSKPKTVGLIIGPEGGITDEECRKLIGFGAKSASLGRTILRTETAAIVGAALISYELE